MVLPDNEKWEIVTKMGEGFVTREWPEGSLIINGHSGEEKTALHTLGIHLPEAYTAKSMELLNKADHFTERSREVEAFEKELNNLETEKYEFLRLIKRLGGSREAIIEQINKLKDELNALNTLSDSKDRRDMLALMDGKNCPLYPAECNLDPAIIEQAKNACAAKLLKVDIPQNIEELVKRKERELIRAEERLNLYMEKETGESSAERIQDLNRRIVEIQKTINKVIYSGRPGKSKSFFASKIPSFIKIAGEVGLVCEYKEGALSINGLPADQISRSEFILASYALQMALDCPIVICDDLDSVDKMLRGTLIKHAVDSGRNVLFLATLNERPRKAPGVKIYSIYDIFENGTLESEESLAEAV